MGNQASVRPEGNLPEAVTSFVGRRREMAAARQRMTESRLVTLIGVGGVGKTRLALKVAAESRKAFRDGVWMVDLASLTDASRLAQTVLASLEVLDQSARQPEDKLVHHLRDRQALIVLDNCEHLLEPAAVLVDQLLRAAPGLRVLATSREPLRIDGEHLLAVPPLFTPAVTGQPGRPAEALNQYEAVLLLVDRARCVRPDFEVTEENHKAVARLCAWLDGIPLAIELAATRLRSLSVAEVVDRLDDRFGFLTGGSRAAQPRQQTLYALINWSYELCSREEQLLWARLSVFAGTFDLAAAEGVCEGDGLRRETIVDLVDQLVAKSVLIADRRGERVRYRMLMTVREFGADLLVEAGEQCAFRRRHRDHYLARAREMAATWCGPGQAAALARMRDDHPNLVACLDWSVNRTGEARTAAALAAALRYHWVVGGFLGEGRRWLDQILDDLETDPLGGPERGEALWVASWISLVQGDWTAGKQRLTECAALAEDLADPGLAAHAAHWEGLAVLFGREVPASLPLFQRALDGHLAAGDTAAFLTASFQYAVSLSYDGEFGQARATCDRAIETADECGERWSRAYTHWATGIVKWQEGALCAAQEVTREALRAQQDFRDGICVALSVELLAWIAAKQSAADLAARLFGAAAAVWSEIGTEMHSFGHALEQDSIASADLVERILGPRRFAELRAQGRALDMAGAIEFALSGSVSGEAPPAARPAPDDQPLSRREVEVARLIAQGLSNRAIAESLVISPRTVDGHVERILGKLGFGSRTQVATWVADHLPAPNR